MKLLRPLLALAVRPSVTFAVGCILLVTNLVELGEDLYAFSAGIEGEHGGVLFGLLLALKSLGEADENLGKVVGATERPRET